MLEKGIELVALVEQDNFSTPIKNRFLAEGQQLMRADYEPFTSLSKGLEEKVMVSFEQSLAQYDIVVISDYGKGFLTTSLTKALLRKSRELGVSVIVDPKGNDFTKYNGAYLIKPNLREAYGSVGCEKGVSIEKVAKRMFAAMEMEYLLITRAEKGMVLFSKELQQTVFPVIKKDVLDVTGAGDTALAIIAVGLANTLPFNSVIETCEYSSRDSN